MAEGDLSSQPTHLEGVLVSLLGEHALLGEQTGQAEVGPGLAANVVQQVSLPQRLLCFAVVAQLQQTTRQLVNLSGSHGQIQTTNRAQVA